MPHCSGTSSSNVEYNPQIGRFFVAIEAAIVVVGLVPAHTGTIAAAFCPYTADQSHVDPPPMLSPATYTRVASTLHRLFAKSITDCTCAAVGRTLNCGAMTR